MPSHNQQYHSPYSPSQLFDILANVQSYHEFLPWVEGCRIHSRSDNIVIAELMIKFKAFHGSYTSKVVLSPPDSINGNAFLKTTLVKGVFKSLTSSWELISLDDGSTNIVFKLNFELKSKILGKVLGAVFNLAVQKMVRAFEGRAEFLYGNKQ